MLNLTDRQWAEFKVGDIVNFTRGKRITTAFAQENQGNIPVIAGGASNNGILCYLDEKCKTSRILKEHCITVATYGTAGCVHYQGSKCFIDDKAMALNIKDSRYDNTEVSLFITVVLGTLQERYSYGRGVTIDRYSEEIILLPVTSEGQPDYEFMEQYIREREPDYSWATGSIESDAEISLSDRQWAEFKVGDIFTIEKCKCGSASKLAEGNIPYVGATNRNNGVIRFVDAEQKMITKGNCIVFICDGQGSIGHSIYKQEDFVGSTTVKAGRNTYLNKYNAQFIVSVLEENANIYNYGYKRTDDRLKKEIIHLPITPDGQPDYDFMEQYIKSLPFSAVLEA